LSKASLDIVTNTVVAGPAIVLTTIDREKLDELTLFYRKPINVVGEIM
jgi:hypothetical protein